VKALLVQVHERTLAEEERLRKELEDLDVLTRAAVDDEEEDMDEDELTEQLNQEDQEDEEEAHLPKMPADTSFQTTTNSSTTTPTLPSQPLLRSGTTTMPTVSSTSIHTEKSTISEKNIETPSVHDDKKESNLLTTTKKPTTSTISNVNATTTATTSTTIAAAATPPPSTTNAGGGGRTNSLLQPKASSSGILASSSQHRPTVTESSTSKSNLSKASIGDNSSSNNLSSNSHTGDLSALPKPKYSKGLLEKMVLKSGNLVRGLVSKKKVRYHQDGFDLDLAYITKNIIAMGLPADGKEALYRNPIGEVYNFFEKKHKGHYMIYNLCEEKTYDPQNFDGRVEKWPFKDHNPPPLSMMLPFCLSVDKWLKADKDNVAAIHCKAGKGRTGVMISCMLMFTETCGSATEALQYFSEKRTKDGKGVTIPSQARFVCYFETCLKKGFPQTDVEFLLTQVFWNKVPLTKPSVNCIISCNKQVVFDWKKANHGELMHCDGTLLLWPLKVKVKGDVKVEYFDQDEEKMFHFYFNTNFLEPGSTKFTLKKKELDGGCKKDKKCKIYPPEFAVQLKLASNDNDAVEEQTNATSTIDEPSEEH